MTIMLYDVHVIRENAHGRYLDLNDDFSQLCDGLQIVLNRWNDVLCRNSAQLLASRVTCEELRNIVRILSSAIDDADATAQALEATSELEREAKMLEDYVK